MSSLEKTFELSKRGSTVRQEIIAGLTTFLAMVYSVIVVPKMLGDAGFPAESVFIATCLVAGLGSILIGFWANAPMAIGCAISLTAFTAFSLVIGQHVSIPVALGAVFLMGLVFTLISATGIRSWILRNLPSSIAHGAGIGIGLFLLLIAANGVGLVVGNQAGLPVKLGDFTSFPVMMSLIGLAFIIGLEKIDVELSKIKEPILEIEVRDDIEEEEKTDDYIMSIDVQKVEDMYTSSREYLVNHIPEKAKDYKDYIMFLPDIVALIFRLLKDNRVPMKTKAVVGASLGYVVCPFDILPDKIPFVGALDDLSVIFFALNRIINDVDINVILENWQGENEFVVILRKTVEFFSGFTGANNLDNIYEVIDVITN